MLHFHWLLRCHVTLPEDCGLRRFLMVQSNTVVVDSGPNAPPSGQSGSLQLGAVGVIGVSSGSSAPSRTHQGFTPLGISRNTIV